MKQTSFFKNAKKSFGPEDFLGKRKSARPLSSKHIIHLVLRSDEVVKMGRFYKYKNQVKAEIERFARQFGIRIYRLAILGNHIHLSIQIQNRRAYVQFIQSVTGSIALKVSNSWKKLKSTQILAPKKSFWSGRPFTRILNWGRDAKTALNYTVQNEFEAHGALIYKNRNANSLSERLSLLLGDAPASFEDQRDAALGLGQMRF